MKLKTYIVKVNTPAGWIDKMHALSVDIKNSGCIHSFAGVMKTSTTVSVLGEDILNEPALNAILVSHFILAVPQAVTPRQIRLALLSIGITEAIVDGLLASMPSPTKEAAQITWKTSTMFFRDNPLVPLVAAALHKTPEDLDALWTLASTL